jgi:hypothetical protein
MVLRSTYVDVMALARRKGLVLDTQSDKMVMSVPDVLMMRSRHAYAPDQDNDNPDAAGCE